MTDTAIAPSNTRDRRGGPAPLIDDEFADQMLGACRGRGAKGPDGSLSQVTKPVLKRAG
jgi:hypothetical protein